MKIHALIFWLLILMFVSACKTLSFSPEEIAVQEGAIQLVYNNYQTAIIEKKSAEAVTYLDGNTIKWYEDILKMVKQYDKSKLQQKDILTQLNVLLIRDSAPREDIQKFDGRSLIEFCIFYGLIGKESVEGIQPYDIQINDRTALAKLEGKDGDTGSKIGFSYEKPTWKLDLTVLFPYSEIALLNTAKSYSMNEEDFVLMVVQSVSQKRVTEDIWNPISK